MKCDDKTCKLCYPVSKCECCNNGAKISDILAADDFKNSGTVKTWNAAVSYLKNKIQECIS
jgi:hypothetical protein